MGDERQPNYWATFEEVRAAASVRVRDHSPVSPDDVRQVAESLIQTFLESGEAAPEEIGGDTHWFLVGALSSLVFEWTRREAPAGGALEESVGTE